MATGSNVIQRILIVCVGNICRSPMAEALLRAHLRGRHVTIESAGLAALVGKPIDVDAAAVLADHGLAAEAHSARKLTPELLSAADLVLVMDQRQLSAVRAIAPQATGKTFLLGRWIDDADIPDPYGHTRFVFEETFALIRRAVEGWITRI
jgi:protein-tyrosine phosphatase